LVGGVSTIPSKPDPKVHTTFKFPSTLPREETLLDGWDSTLYHWSRDEKKIRGDINGCEGAERRF